MIEASCAALGRTVNHWTIAIAPAIPTPQIRPNRHQDVLRGKPRSVAGRIGARRSPTVRKLPRRPKPSARTRQTMTAATTILPVSTGCSAATKGESPRVVRSASDSQTRRDAVSVAISMTPRTTPYRHSLRNRVVDRPSATTRAAKASWPAMSHSGTAPETKTAAIEGAALSARVAAQERARTPSLCAGGVRHPSWATEAGTPVSSANVIATSSGHRHALALLGDAGRPVELSDDARAERIGGGRLTVRHVDH